MSCEQSLSNHSSCVLVGWVPQKKNSRAYVSAGGSSTCMYVVCVCVVCGVAPPPSFILMKRILFHFLVLSGKQTSAGLTRPSPTKSNNVRLGNAFCIRFGRFCKISAHFTRVWDTFGTVRTLPLLLTRFTRLVTLRLGDTRRCVWFRTVHTRRGRSCALLQQDDRDYPRNDHQHSVTVARANSDRHNQLPHAGFMDERRKKITTVQVPPSRTLRAPVEDGGTVVEETGVLHTTGASG